MWCNVWGHDRKEIINAMKMQLDSLPHSTIFGLVNKPSTMLAEKLISLAKGMGKVFYSDNGSTAIEVALKMAIQYWRNIGKSEKRKFICFKNGYHGDTLGCMSVGYVGNFFSPYKSLLLGTIKVDAPTIGIEAADNFEFSQYIEQIEQVLKEHSKYSAAIVMESGAQIAGGVKIYPRKFQKSVSQLCKKYDVLLILDEVATGFGRLGNMIEYNAQDSDPDIACFAKALTGGYFPLAVTLTKNNIYEKFLGEYYEKKHFFHGHTFAGQPVGCAAALANLKLYDRFNLIKRINSKSILFHKLLKKFTEIDVVSDVRHKGLLAGIEIKLDAKTSKYSKNGILGAFIFRESLKRGIFMRTLGNVITIIPPLSISMKNLSEIINAEYDIVNLIQRKFSD
jgi:adenosylmethionine-8-amino-7-oxononanoate aminotransferase